MFDQFDFSTFDQDSVKRELRRETVTQKMLTNLKRLPVKPSLQSKEKEPKAQTYKQSLVSFKDLSVIGFDKDKFARKAKKLEKDTEISRFTGLKVRPINRAEAEDKFTTQTSEEPTNTVLKTATEFSDFDNTHKNLRQMSLKDLKASSARVVNSTLTNFLKPEKKVVQNSQVDGEPIELKFVQKNFRVESRYKVPSTSREPRQEGNRMIKGRHRVSHLSHGSIHKEIQFDQKSNTCKIVGGSSSILIKKELGSTSAKRTSRRSNSTLTHSRRFVTATGSALISYRDTSDAGIEPVAVDKTSQIKQKIKESVTLLFKNITIPSKSRQMER